MLTLIKKPEAIQALAESNSTFYSNIAKGLVPPPINLGVRSVAWPRHEIESVVAARIAGKTPEEIKTLVQQLVAKRQNLMAYSNTEGASA